MSTDHVIEVEDLSKRYIIGHQRDRDEGLRHALERAVRAPLAVLKSGGGASGGGHEDFWALRDLNFQMKQGEAVGIIGRNGAGKSTLLKILSRITEPTKGRVILRGRVAALLEVGTGFHPELTGRENIFLNGAILGMSRLEIKKKFDQIVDFSGIEKFLDTPVKRYSSGMSVRLAFSVAAHLEPEILVVDEVLAVGDAHFQKKCLEKMDDVGSSGRTVIFVSHNMQAVTRLCDRCIWIDKGKQMMDGPAHEIANAYVNAGTGTSAERVWEDPRLAPGDEVARLRGVRVRAQSGELSGSFDIREPVGVELDYEILKPGYTFHSHFMLTNESGTELFVSMELDPEWRGRKREPGRYISTGWIPGNLLAEGSFSVTAVIMSLDPAVGHGVERDAVLFRVVDDLSQRDTARGDYLHPIPGLMRPMLKWQTKYQPAKTLAEAR